jgi:ribonuclease Z
MKYLYQVLSTPTADTPGSTIVLQHERRKYLFGHVAEGTQRTFVESGTTLSQLTQIFITGKSTWANNGGVLGTILTIADAWNNTMTEVKKTLMIKKRSKASDDELEPLQKLTIHGGKNLSHMIGTARRFIFRKHAPLVINEYDSASLSREHETGTGTDPFAQPTWSDENINVWAMSLRPSYEKRFESPKSGFKSPRKRSLNEFEERDERDEQFATLDPKVKDQLVREHIVSEMFNSDWRLDTLHEEKLRNVKMPATIFVRHPVTKDLERYTGPLPGSSESVPDINVFVRKPWPAAMIERLPATSPSSESMCYFIRHHDQRGKFDVKKAIELGVPKGPAYHQLSIGNCYTCPDGKVVTPDMVLGPTRKGRAVAIIDAPSELYIDDLLARPEWRSPTLTDTMSTIFWILGPGVGDDSRIIEFASRMKNCDHIVLGTDYCPNHLTMLSAAKSTLRLARLNNDNFLVPIYDNVEPERPNPNASLAQKLPWKPAKPGLLLDMEPKYGLNESSIVPPLNTHEIITRIPRAVQQRLTATQKRLRSPSVMEKVIEMREGLPPLAAESEVITLGTGSSSPSKYRNVSATLLHVPGKGYYLFDCGENTLGQLKRVYSPEKLREVMQNLRLIWISHLHADHHLGTVSVIREWYEVNYGLDKAGSESMTDEMEEILTQKRLCVISENMFIQWLEEYAGVEDFGFNRLLPLSTIPEGGKGGEKNSSFVYRHIRADGTFANGGPQMTSLQFNDRSSKYNSELRELTGLKDVRAVYVNHCRGSMAVALEWDGGFKVSYSGDCRPSRAFTEIGKNSTLLIHEATFQDDLRGQALAKKHSTAAEAIEVGRYMNARMVLLTHFSQRYAKITKIDANRAVPELSEARAEFINRVGTMDVPDSEVPDDDGLDVTSKDDIGLSMVTNPKNQLRNSPMPVCVAFDYMKVKIRDIPISQMFSPVFEKLIVRLEQAADEESFELRGKELAAMQVKNPKKFKKGSDIAKLPSRPLTERKHSAWSASESESGWSDDSDLDEGDEKNIAS